MILFMLKAFGWMDADQSYFLLIFNVDRSQFFPAESANFIVIFLSFQQFFNYSENIRISYA